MQFCYVDYTRNRRALWLKCLIFIIGICEIRMYQLVNRKCCSVRIWKTVKLSELQNRLFFPNTCHQWHPIHFVAKGFAMFCSSTVAHRQPRRGLFVFVLYYRPLADECGSVPYFRPHWPASAVLRQQTEQQRNLTTRKACSMTMNGGGRTGFSWYSRRRKYIPNR